MVRRVAISGVTGLVGSGLPPLLAKAGYEVTGISRAGSGDVPGVAAWQSAAAIDLAGHEAVIHLAGEPVDQRWTDEARVRFHESRIGTTRAVVEAMGRCDGEERPRVLVNASAVGYYGDRGDEVLLESSPAGEGYLAGLCREWEAAAMEAEKLNVRVVCMRIGVVLGKNGRAFRKLVRVFKAGIGGRLGDGRQWMPWIHVDDLRAALAHAVDSAGLSGPVNAIAPHPERNVDFTRKLAKALHRPAFFPVPAFALKLAVGDFAQVLLAGQRATPDALLKDGFCFRHATLESALADLLE
jgi:uncharacterized protein